MTRKEQNKILDDKIESNNNQYKIDRLNAEISAFSSGDLNKYEFLTRKDLNYKPNALDKARFEFSPLGRAFNEGLDKTIPNYQEEGIIKLLKEIRDNLAGGINIPPRLIIPPVYQVHQAHQVQEEHQDNQDHKDCKDHKDQEDHQVQSYQYQFYHQYQLYQQEHQVHQDQL